MQSTRPQRKRKGTEKNSFWRREERHRDAKTKRRNFWATTRESARTHRGTLLGFPWDPSDDDQSIAIEISIELAMASNHFQHFRIKSNIP